MKVLLTHRFFWPDTAPYAVMLRSIGNQLSDAEYEVSVFASRPSYRTAVEAPKNEVLDALDVRRCWVFSENRSNPVLRLANVFLYCCGLFVHVLRTRPNIVTASTFPPVVAAWTASLAARMVNAKFVYHMMDIHPEVSRISGGILGRGIAMRFLRWLDNQTLRRSSAIVVLSNDMKQTLQDREVGELPIHVINNFYLDDFGADESPPEQLVKAKGKKRVIFAGNLGRFQNLPLLVEGISRSFADHPELELLLLGDGAAEDELKNKWEKHPQVIFAPFLPFPQAKSLIADADVGLVSLLPEMYRVAYPSKMLTHLGLGLPQLLLVEPESDMAKEIVENGLGEVADPNTTSGVHQALERILDRPKSEASVGEWYERNLSRTTILKQWVRLFGELRNENDFGEPK